MTWPDGYELLIRRKPRQPDEHKLMSNPRWLLSEAHLRN